MYLPKLKLTSSGKLLFFLLGASLSLMSTSAQYPIDVEYRKRDHRFEGVKSQPVGGYYIELISAIAIPREDATQLPDKLRLRFFLKQLRPVYITVRERDPQHNYWMDQVIPRTPWRPGFSNEFAWPTGDVLGRLKPSLRISDLAAIARLERPSPSQNERVAPLVLYHSRLPSRIEGYMFTFKMDVDARLSCSIFRENGSTPIVVQNFPRLAAGRPFPFIWKSSNASEGEYKLIIQGKKLSNNEDVNLSVSFYNQPLTR